MASEWPASESVQTPIVHPILSMAFRIVLRFSNNFSLSGFCALCESQMAYSLYQRNFCCI